MTLTELELLRLEARHRATRLFLDFRHLIPAQGDPTADEELARALLGEMIGKLTEHMTLSLNADCHRRILLADH